MNLLAAAGTVNPLAGLIGAIIAVTFSALLVRTIKRPSALRGMGEPVADKLPYKARNYLFSKAERSFYEVLRRCVGDEHIVFAKVRLSDLLCVPKGTKGWQTHFNRIQSKHIDFVVCDVTHVRARLVIELDDSSHAAEERQIRDDFVDDALAAAGLPLVRVPACASYAMTELREMIAPHISRRADIAEASSEMRIAFAGK